MARTSRTSTSRTSDAEARSGVIHAVEACDAKKAADIALLELEKDSGAFTDYFVVCSGSNPRQIQAISDEVEQRLAKAGMRPTHVEGYNQAEWVLLDYVDFVVHVFSENARKFYDLERLWKSAKRLTLSDLKSATRKSAGRATRTSHASGGTTRSSARTARSRSLEPETTTRRRKKKE